MSEELLQTIPQQIGKYTYYRLGATTLDQLKASGIIPARNYERLSRKKPDGILLRGGAVKAVIEYKTPEELATETLIEKATDQEIDVAKSLCKIFILTDASKSIWINALNRERIKDAQGNPVQTVFHPFPVRDVDTLEYLVDEIDASLTETSSTILSAHLIDPSPLASRLWQTIWVATGKSPVKCLYNVVELFVFKFLSDLAILDPDTSFDYIYKKALAKPEDGLDYYARNTRTKIYRLFPSSQDGTTIINGTIFVNEEGEANLSQSILFLRCLEHLKKYGEEFGSLTKIDKQFKTKLYESFLGQEVEALGQYFTPRKVVRSMIRMAGLDQPTFQFRDKRFCDPFCGLGGFPLELLNLNEGMMACYAPDNAGAIHVPFTMHGFDKGFERDDERTIILAKANMLIYLAELLFSNPTATVEFARVFNETFRLFKDNLGTFGHIIKAEDAKYDFILSNPPYVTSGSSIIKAEIKQTPRTRNEYPVNALGLEGLSIEWVIKSLKPGGKAFLVIPDGILTREGGKLRAHIIKECFLDAIVSLPERTFFANNEHTYILALTKKQRPTDVQADPVFTYLVSSIGERLTSVRREQIDTDDMPEVETFFRIFSSAKLASKSLLEATSKRCKIQEFRRFRDSPNWYIDRWWTKAERIAAGIQTQGIPTSKADIENAIARVMEAIGDYQAIRDQRTNNVTNWKDVSLGDVTLFKLSIGDRVLRKNVLKSHVVGLDAPVYSANVFIPIGYKDASNLEPSVNPVILWGIDGNFGLRSLPKGEVFTTTDHCGMIEILTDQIDPDYLLSALFAKKQEEEFDRSFRASLSNMGRMTVTIPVTNTGGGDDFDLVAQRQIAERFVTMQEKRMQLVAMKSLMDNVFGSYI